MGVDLSGSRQGQVVQYMHLPEGSKGKQEYQSGKLASQLRFILGTYQIQAPCSTDSETSIYEVLCGFFSAHLQNSGLEPQISS